MLVLSDSYTCIQKVLTNDFLFQSGNNSKNNTTITTAATNKQTNSLRDYGQSFSDININKDKVER